MSTIGMTHYLALKPHVMLVLDLRMVTFVMVGLEHEGKTVIARLFSIASANYEDELEFFSIKVPDGRPFDI